MYGEQVRRGGGFGIEEADALVLERLADPVGAGRQLGAGGANADPHLAPGLVQADAVTPHNWHRQSHQGSLGR